MLGILRILRRGDRGQGMVEFALVLPLLLLVMFGVIETGRLLFIYSVVFTSTREAARYGSAAGLLTGALYQYQDCNGIRAAAKRVGAFAGVQDSDITITYDRVTDTGVSPLGSCPIGGTGPKLTLGNRVTVRVSVNYRPIVPLPNFPSFPITSTSSRTLLKNISIQGTPIASSSTLPVVYFAPATFEQIEGDDGSTTVVTVTALLNGGPAEQNVTINFSLSGSATQGVDYNISESSPLFIAAGQSSATINITVIGDDLSEFNETVVVTIESTINAERGEPAIYELAIIDDDSDPFVKFAPPYPLLPIQENLGFIDMDVLLVNPDGSPATSGKDVEVMFSLTGTALEGSDYIPPAALFTIPAGSSSITLRFEIIDDGLDEADEIFIVTMESIVNANPGTNTVQTATILDNDDQPIVSFTTDSQIVSESIGIVLVTAWLRDGSGTEIASGLPVSVPFSVGGTATNGLDYTISPSPLVISAGSTRADIVIYVESDGVVESDETIIVTMGAPTNAVQGLPSVQTITVTPNPTVFFTLASQSVHENVLKAVIEVQLLPAQSAEISVPFSLGGTATQGQDYTLEKNSPIVFSAGETAKTISLILAMDGLDELDETVEVTLGTPSAGVLGTPNVHLLTLIDDDPQPIVTFSSPDQSVDESAGNASVQVRLSAKSGLPVTVPLSLGGSATQGSDYIFNQPSVVIPAGITSTLLTVQVIDDLLPESFETIVLAMGAPTNAVLGTPSTHAITINTNDQPTCDIFNGTGIVFNPDGMSLSIPLSYSGTDLLILTQLTISWPTGAPNSPKFDKVFFNSSEVYDGNHPNSPVTVTSWNGPASNRRLTSTTSTIKLTFTRSLDPGTYVLTLVFHNYTTGYDCAPPVQSSAILQP